MLCILYGSKRLGRRRRHKTEGRSTTSNSAETQDEGFISPSSSMLTLTQSDSAQNLSTSGLSSASGETPKPQVCAVIFILQTFVICICLFLLSFKSLQDCLWSKKGSHFANTLLYLKARYPTILRYLSLWEN